MFGKGFTRLWSASAISGLGDGSRIAALAVFAATLSDDPLQVALVLIAARVPWVFVGPLTGILVDRVDRWRALWICDVLRVAVTGGFVALILAGQESIALLIAVSFVLSSIATFAENLSQAVVPDVTGSGSLDSANSRLMTGQVVMTEFLGAPIGTALFVVGRALPFALDTVTFAIAAVLVFSIRMPRRAVVVQKAPLTFGTIRAEFAEGLRWLLQHRAMRTMCVLVGLVNFSIVSVLAIAALYALDVLHISAGTYGLLLVVIAVGGLLGMLLAPMISKALGRGRALQLGFALCPLPFLVGGLTSNAFIAAGALAFVGASISIGNVITASVRQTLVPEGLFGRVNGVYRLVINGLSPLGGLVGGALAAQFGLRAPFFFAAGLVLLAALAAVRLLPNGALQPPPTAAVGPDEHLDPVAQA
jgi:MFS family permease